MENVVRKVSQLTSLLSSFSTDNKISLPRLAVVGQQSSGKSSVLEGLIGMEILPRASGLCTRVPLILSIINDKSLKNIIYGEFSHLSEEDNKKRFQTENSSKNAEMIGKEIINRTNQLTKPNELKNSPISLTVRSATFPNLTLVDLPGLTKISISGQSEGVVKDIENMVREFISPKSTIILAVIPANVDIANSDALSIAQEYDPSGNRTLGIVTKLDLMDKGTDAISVLKNKEFYLKLGYIGVINRGQLDLDNKMSIEKAKKKERNFFEMHPAYSEIADICGFDFLNERLGKIFSDHVSSMLPKLKREIVEIVFQLEKKLRYIENEEGSLEEKMTSAILSFCKPLQQYLEGVVPNDGLKMLFGGAALKEIINTKFKEDLDSLTILDDFDNKDLEKLSIQTMGLDSNLLFDEKAFKSLIGKELEKLKKPCLEVTKNVFNETMKIVQNAIQASNLKKYPNLLKEINSFLSEFLDESKKKISDKLETRLRVEISCVNIDHPGFYNTPMEAIQYAEEKVSKTMIYHERTIMVQKIITEKLVSSYLNLVKDAIEDILIKMSQKELILPLKLNISEMLILRAFKFENKEEIMLESENIAEERNELLKKLKLGRKALDIFEGIYFD